MQPVVDKFAAVGGLRLGNLVFMVGKLQVLPAAVDVDGLAQVAVGHGGAFDVPAGTAGPPGGIPSGFAGLSGLPQGEVQGIFLHFSHGDTGAGLEILDGLMGELAVALEFQGAIVHIAIFHRIGVALVDEGLHHVDDLLHIFRGLGVDGGGTDAQTLCIGEVLLDVLFRHFLGGDALLVGTLDNLVVYVGEVLHERHLVAAVLQIAAQHVEHDDRARVADVDVVIHRRAAGVHTHFARLDRHELFLLHGHGVVQFHIQAPLRRICNKKAPPCRPA